MTRKIMVGQQSGSPRGRRTPQRIAGALAVAVPLALAVAPSAVGDGNFHGYSVGQETSYAGEYAGLGVTRVDRAVDGQANTGCGDYFTGNPVYQTQWVSLPGPGDWIEVGTGHQCGDTKRYWFWGYGQGGDWNPIGVRGGVNNGESHRFVI